MFNIKKVKLLVVFFASIYIIVSTFLILGYLHEDVAIRLGYATIDKLFMQAVMPMFIYPLIIIIILAYYESIVSGLLILGNEIYLLIKLHSSIDFNIELMLFGIIPTIIALLYVFSYIKGKKKHV